MLQFPKSLVLRAITANIWGPLLCGGVLGAERWWISIAKGESLTPNLLALAPHSWLSSVHTIHLFIYFWLCWGFITVWGLSLVMASRGYSLLQCVGFSCSSFSLWRAQALGHAGFNSHNTEVQWLWLRDSRAQTAHWAKPLSTQPRQGNWVLGMMAGSQASTWFSSPQKTAWFGAAARSLSMVLKGGPSLGNLHSSHRSQVCPSFSAAIWG